ncbi:MAG: presqualene diphosphate synthase HpnD [Verrucomicrobiota bacterium]|nr:presqualene diphosphate synthase HpnD [Verrucomicrobiota bacterium]MDP6250590.1 presqualene diphosphate synthase HpnD [Verrucomicrobiota bacterium]MDP7291187.1 presqualene diphosphate synthase HpnD [Verrucomicrobiota bacterium]MDP7440284.1 presqualene diphosphate synthase HpnD [Verrucomicrobiota bacterium]HJN82099.1 presqualene diphosphate synthase HpnD [Verrucomicrobiota bacterium]
MIQPSQSQLVTAKSGSNLAAAFFLLPKAKRRAMVTLYAFCREVDDAADDDSVPSAKRAASLQQWRDDIRRACEWGEPQFQVCRELRPFIRQFALPFYLFDELLVGMESDLEKNRYRDFDELKLYCHRVASVVGLLSIRIFKCDGDEAERYAENLGQALQLTNILRDVAEDAKRGRIYLPQSMLEKHEVAEEDILNGRFSAGYANATQEIAERAWAHYRLARESFPEEQRQRLVASEAMGGIYWRLLGKLRAVQYNVFQSNGRRLKINHLDKLGIGLKTWLRSRRKSYTPDYG